MDTPFDDLARSLAAPLPRRRALALFAVTALGAALGLNPRPASAGHCATERVCRGGKCIRPFDGSESQDCKCPAGAKDGDGCVDARPHCGSSDNPCPPGKK